MDSKLSDEDKGYIGNSSSSDATGVALAGGAASDVDPMRPWRALGSAAFRAAPLINCAPVPTAWARGAREGLSLSLRARSLPVAFRASDVVVHVQGAQAREP